MKTITHWRKNIRIENYNCDIKRKKTKGFTLLELLVSIAIIFLLLAIMMPLANRARRGAVASINMNNQRMIVIAVNSFAGDNGGRYPESAATIGAENTWNWQEPTMMAACEKRNPKLMRSMSGYLQSYISNPGILFCPSAPKEYKYLKEMWLAGDDWDNPETPWPQDSVIGNYCFYWNYAGSLEGRNKVFYGPAGQYSENGKSKLLVSDYFGFGHWRNKLIYEDCRAYGSCERINSASVTPATSVSSAFWSRWAGDANLPYNMQKIELHAAYIDGHVETYYSSDTIPIRVFQKADGTTPYPADLGPGIFYLPEKALP